MVVASATLGYTDIIRARRIPEIDLSQDRDRVKELVVKACEEFGFFKVIKHGVPEELITRMESAGSEFFALPAREKMKAGPPTPLGYGSKTIGFNGDVGELEYLLLHANPAFVSNKAVLISKKDPSKFSYVVNEYVDAVRQLSCEILAMVGEGLGLRDSGALSRAIRDSESDCLVRLNHYPQMKEEEEEEEDNISSRSNANRKNKVGHHRRHHHNHNNNNNNNNKGRVGFGEHSDPQILSILHSNDVDGLQIRSPADGGVDGAATWVPVPPDPDAFFVHVGDLLQAMTNGRLVSVRHRAMANSSYKSRLSIVFFGAPPLHSLISPLPEMITPAAPRRYKSFTWAEYKKTMYSLRLSHNRLDLFRADGDDERS
ncbi:gibberellin 2-beta-dioxygenase 6-like isoform X2 [Typha latifolia]|uniref:gibberellin 2-beta-dioxygenase 6-like isoform X2 n=1 Tax=Typha latifolia TaxID=4733 RepID=UPI003C301104